MCDVDAEAVVSRTPTYRASTSCRRCCTPKDWTRTSYVGSTCPSATSTGRLERAARPGAPPEEEVTIALVGKYVDLPDAYLSVVEALRAGGIREPGAGQRSAGCRRTSCETPDGAARRARRRRRGLHPRRLRHPRRRGQGRRGPLRPREPDSDPGPLPGPAVHGDRDGPAPGRPQRRELRGVRAGDARPGHRDDGRAGRHRRRRRRPRRHDALGCVSRRRCGAGSVVAEAYGARTCPSGTGTATR